MQPSLAAFVDYFVFMVTITAKLVTIVIAVVITTIAMMFTMAWRTFLAVPVILYERNVLAATYASRLPKGSTLQVIFLDAKLPYKLAQPLSAHHFPRFIPNFHVKLRFCDS